MNMRDARSYKMIDLSHGTADDSIIEKNRYYIDNKKGFSKTC